MTNNKDMQYEVVRCDRYFLEPGDKVDSWGVPYYPEKYTKEEDERYRGLRADTIDDMLVLIGRTFPCSGDNYLHEWNKLDKEIHGTDDYDCRILNEDEEGLSIMDIYEESIEYKVRHGAVDLSDYNLSYRKEDDYLFARLDYCMDVDIIVLKKVPKAENGVIAEIKGKEG